jgi:hypothetical protein
LERVNLEMPVEERGQPGCVAPKMRQQHYCPKFYDEATGSERSPTYVARVDSRMVVSLLPGFTELCEFFLNALEQVRAVRV